MNRPATYDISKILEVMRADYWRNLEEAEQAGTVEQTDYLVVVLGRQRFGLPASSCREVLKLPRIVRVPRLPRHLPGIVNLRGEIVAVTDLRPLLHLEVCDPTASSRLVVVVAGPSKTALLVEAVDGMRTVAANEVMALAGGASPGTAELLQGKVEDASAVLLLFDSARLLARPELVVDQKAVQRPSTDSDEVRAIPA